MGSFNHKERKTYQNICHLSEQGVLHYMNDLLSAKYGKDAVIVSKSYIVALGNIPVALVAHADTVFKVPPSIEYFYYDENADVIWNPDGAGADDRAGIYAISYILRTTKLRPHIIISTGEECGCIGAGKLIGKIRDFPAKLKFMIQLDRRHRNDSVYYDCDNPEFEDFINSYGFETAWGSFTDISVLAPAWKVAAVNLSIGYENEHTNIELLHVDWMYETIQKTCDILDDISETTPSFEYIEAKYFSYPGLSKYNWYNQWDDDDIAGVDSKQQSKGFPTKQCFMCSMKVPAVETVPIWYPHGIRSYDICTECYSDLAHRIVWCKKCNRGIYLSAEEAREIPDVNNWVCEDCKNGNQQNTEAIQSSNWL